MDLDPSADRGAPAPILQRTAPRRPWRQRLVGDRRRPAAQLVLYTGSPNNDTSAVRLGHNLLRTRSWPAGGHRVRVWHFQTVHHDLWTKTSPRPQFCSLRKDGARWPQWAWPRDRSSLHSHRETGERSSPSRSAPFPQATWLAKFAAATQPFPRPLRARADRPEAADAGCATEQDRAWCREAIAGLGRRFFTPPHSRDAVVPGTWAAWRGAHGARPVNDLLIMPVNNLPRRSGWFRETACSRTCGGRLGGEFETPQNGTRYGMVRRFLLGPTTHLPASPPWGRWPRSSDERPGRVAGAARPVPGTDKIPAWRTRLNRARRANRHCRGPVFTAGTLEGAIYAFDCVPVRLWRWALPTRALDPDDVSRSDGRQYVVIAAGGHGNRSAAHRRLLVASPAQDP